MEYSTCIILVWNKRLFLEWHFISDVFFFHSDLFYESRLIILEPKYQVNYICYEFLVEKSAKIQCLVLIFLFFLFFLKLCFFYGCLYPGTLIIWNYKFPSLILTKLSLKVLLKIINGLFSWMASRCMLN